MRREQGGETIREREESETNGQTVRQTDNERVRKTERDRERGRKASLVGGVLVGYLSQQVGRELPGSWGTPTHLPWHSARGQSAHRKTQENPCMTPPPGFSPLTALIFTDHRLRAVSWNPNLAVKRQTSCETRLRLSQQNTGTQLRVIQG